jgi:transposase-like protein
VTHARTQHPNAPLTPQGPRRMVVCVLEQRWTIEQTAERFQVEPKTVRKWRDRFVAEDDDGLFDRSSRPHRFPNRTRPKVRGMVLRLRRQHRWGADHIPSRPAWRRRSHPGVSTARRMPLAPLPVPFSWPLTAGQRARRRRATLVRLSAARASAFVAVGGSTPGVWSGGDSDCGGVLAHSAF